MAVIGFIGLGNMGLPMAKRLAAAGHTVKVAVHKNPAPAQDIVALGGIVAPTVAEVVRDVAYIISIVPEDAQLKALFLDPQLTAGIAPGTTLIEMTSCAPRSMKEVADFLAAKGVQCLDAPVSGGVKGAEEGTLTIMCGGQKEIFDNALPVLRVMGTNVVLVGGMGAGKAVKAVNQLLVSVNTLAAAEALSFARHMNLDLDVLYDVISTSTGGSTAFKNKFKKMAVRDYSAGFKLPLMRKDIRIALEEAAGIPMPLSALTYQLFHLMERKDEEADYSVINKIYDKNM